MPIINDTSIEIGEAWMPPVANDTMVHAAEDSVQDRHLLGYQFAQEDGREKLLLYLKKKYAVCDKLAEIETAAHEFLKTERIETEIDLPRTLKLTQEESDIDKYLNYFKSQDGSEGHANDDILDIQDLEDMRLMLRRWNWRMWNTKVPLDLSNYWKDNSAAAQIHVTNLAYVRKSTAKDAINAISLEKVVTALKTRNIPLSFKMIADGNPRRFVWKSQERKFTPGQQLTSDGPELLLLGPSEGLVKKLWDKLPVGDYVAALAFSDIPIRSITPSNQLSYVMRVNIKKHGILVCGDAGFVDFKPRDGEYYPALLEKLLPLHVIQVAHHGGCNAHFYRVLLKANYAEQKEKSFLLLSHATDDTHRVQSSVLCEFSE